MPTIKAYDGMENPAKPHKDIFERTTSVARHGCYVKCRVFPQTPGAWHSAGITNFPKTRLGHLKN